MSAQSSQKKVPPRQRQPQDSFESLAATAMQRAAAKIPPRPRFSSPPPDAHVSEPAPASPHEGGARIPTFAEAQAIREQQFFATRKAEFDSMGERESQKVEIEIRQAQEVIKQEIKRLEKMNIQMNDKLKSLQKLALEEGKKKGVYYVRFMEIMTEILRTLVAQVSESNTWLEAMVSKKKKRGSLFATQSKQKGTQYSMSQELSLARSSG